jgi:hypothetical protein
LAVCDFCGKEMDGASSCIEGRIRIGDKDYSLLPYKGKRETLFTKGEALKRCPECNVLPGGFHHVGCVLELCPKCNGKWVFCKCDGLKIRIDSGNGRKSNVIPFRKS